MGKIKKTWTTTTKKKHSAALTRKLILFGVLKACTHTSLAFSYLVTSHELCGVVTRNSRREFPNKQARRTASFTMGISGSEKRINKEGWNSKLSRKWSIFWTKITKILKKMIFRHVKINIWKFWKFQIFFDFFQFWPVLGHFKT